MTWRCVRCGTLHGSPDPPCDSCGHDEFEEAPDETFETVDTGTQYLWVCANCGCQHVKNNPPCSRCGNHELEKVEQRYDGLEDELVAPSWFEVARPYLPVLALAAVVVALFATGILPLSLLFPGMGTPAPPDAPGESEAVAGIDLEGAEGEIHDRLDAEREAQGADARGYDGELAAIAEYRNRQNVVERATGDRPDPPDWDAFDPDCGGERIVLESVEAGSIEGYDDGPDLAEAVADGLVDDHATLVLADRPSEGLDVHVGPDGAVSVTYAVC